MRLFSVCAHFGEENAVMWKGETGVVEIPDKVMDTVKAWLEKNKDIEDRVKAFLTQNADVRTCFILWILYARFSTRQVQREYAKTTHGEETRYVKHHLFVVGHGRSGVDFSVHLTHNVGL